MKDLKIVIGHAAGEQLPAITGAWNASTLGDVAVAMHGDVTAKLAGRIGEEFTDSNVERFCNLDQICDGAGDLTALEARDECIGKSCRVGQFLQFHAPRFPQCADVGTEPRQGLVMNFHEDDGLKDLLMGQEKLLSKQFLFRQSEVLLRIGTRASF
ncbi:hypothetical protein RCO31_05890 [Bradyrhizobium sp. LHD-71]|nr:hypothetical protein [Bradyrhizobium sp. LHD-71]MDQ8727238.1 hypothetical protein [Bradyrhizobium sp. LHD-71]